MTPTERGAYLDLILAYWELGPLPSDDEALQQLARCKDKDWKLVRTKVLAKFILTDGTLTHERVDTERAVAKQMMERKSAAGKAGGKASVQARTKQTANDGSSRTEADVQAAVNTTNLVPTPDGVNHLPSGDGGKPPKPAKGTRLANDWQPGEEIFSHGRDLNLSRGETGVICRAFKEYFLSPDATRPVKRDWDGACKRWVTREAPNTVGRRNRGGRSIGNRPQPGSVVDVVARLKAEADGEDSVSERGWVHDDFAGVRPAADGPGFAGAGAGDGAPIIQSDDAEQLYRDARRAETSDDCAPGTISRHGRTVETLRADVGGIPGGRGAPRAEDPAEYLEVVAGVVGAFGASGLVQQATEDVAEGLAIPAFLRRA